MQGGRAVHRIASSSRCFLSGTQTQHSQAPCSTFTAPTRCYTTSAEDATSPVDSAATAPPPANEPSRSLTLTERLRQHSTQRRETGLTPPPKWQGTKTPVQPVSLKGYQSAQGFNKQVINTFPRPSKSPVKMNWRVSFTSAFVGKEVEKELELRKMPKQRPPRKQGPPSAVLSRGLKRLKPPRPKTKNRQKYISKSAMQEETLRWKSGKRQALFDEVLRSMDTTQYWAAEPWADAVQGRADRTLPPHLTPGDHLAEGLISTSAGLLTDVAPKSQHQPVATLSHGLDRVLFNPGVHWLRDPRSRVYNFTPWLEEIPKVNDFAFERLSGFVKSSRDEDLRALAVQEDRKFAGSTSSMSGMLSHIYFLLSEHKDVETETLSQHFAREPSSFTWGQRSPAAVLLNYKDGHYAIDSYAGEHDDSDKNVLTWLGTLLENFLTKPPNEFKTFLKQESAPITSDEPPMREAYRYAKSDKFVMRSQLDCRDPRLPGTGVFDLKTRACVSIRQDILNYEENAGYMIKTQHGLFESFEREYYDLIRSAFLKYSFQVRIGNMDGVMVAYHNTERIYGFQYISLDEMDERLYGAVPGIGDKIFGKCIGMLEAILEEASALFPEQSILCYFETPTTASRETVMEVFVEPETWDEMMGPKPVEQLSVSVKHLLDGEQVRSRVALRSVEQEWTVKYEVNKAALPLEVVRSSLDLLIQRKSHNKFLPSHIDPENAQEFWESLNFGHRPLEERPKALFASIEEAEAGLRLRRKERIDSEELGSPRTQDADPEKDVEQGKEAQSKRGSRALFASPSAAVQRYREMSRQGRLEYEKMKEAEKGKPKILLGHGVYSGEERLERGESPTPKTAGQAVLGMLSKFMRR